MLFSFGPKSALLLIFFVHGIVFSTLLLVKGIQNNDKPSYWLSAFTFLCTLYITPFMLGYANWYSRNPYRDILFYIPFQQLFLIPPVLYFYCKTLLDQSFAFEKKKDILHFIPAALYLLYTAFVFITDKWILDEYYFYKDGKDKDFAVGYQVTGFLMLLFYLVKSLFVYRRYKAITYNTISYADTLTFGWAKRFLLTFLMLLMIRALFFVLNPEWAQFGRKFWYYLIFSILFYYISISGLINSIRSVTSLKEPASLFTEDADPEVTTDSELPQPPSSHQKQEDSTNDIQDLEIWKEKIEVMMANDKLFENPELTVQHLAEKLNTHPKKISQVINQGFSVNFNDYINQHRVKAVILKMEAGGHTEQTLAGLAYESGFNSKSTFIRAFKRHTKLSPNDYIKKNLG